MSAELEITKELIAHIFEASGKSSGAFSKDIGVTTKALRMYRDGIYMPRKAYTVARLKALANTYGVGSFPESEVSLELPASATTAEFAPEVLKAFQERLGLSVKQVADLVGVTPDSWYKWIKGEGYPTHAKNVKALRKTLAGDKPKGKTGPKSNLTDAAIVKGGKHQLSVTTAHEIASEFHALVQPQIKELVADAALSKVCKHFKSERRSQRGSIGTFFMLVKDIMSPQEIYEWCSGHSS
jgi:DNA-binding transcriptional regulator YiaG